MGLSSEAIETFRPLTWVSIGARDKKEFTHKINETTLHKTAVAVRRINENQLIVSIVCVSIVLSSMRVKLQSPLQRPLYIKLKGTSELAGEIQIISPKLLIEDSLPLSYKRS
jgi:hypothetical protein